VEIARGCPHHCTFCWVGHNCRDFLARPAARVLEMCREAREITGCASVGLISSAVGAHPEINDICAGLLEEGFKVSYSSLRIEEVNEAMLKALVRSGQRGATLAPEAGSERLRRLLGKRISDEEILNAVEHTQRAGLTDLKLYYMTGLPQETERDADRIVELTDAVRRVMLSHGRERGRLGALSVNLGIYTPKPNTPLGRLETPSQSETRKRAARVTRGLSALPNVRVSTDSADLAAAQRFLSNRSFESAALVYRVWRDGGKWRGKVKAMLR